MILEDSKKVEKFFKEAIKKASRQIAAEIYVLFQEIKNSSV